MNIEAPHLQYFGNAGIIISDPGTLSTDKTGLETCTAVFKIKVAFWGKLPAIGAQHPVFTYLSMEKRELVLAGAYAIASCSYAGFSGGIDAETIPLYELTSGLADEPIETHKEFKTKIAGTPIAPLNGAVFRHIKTGVKVSAVGDTTTNADFVFDSFLTNIAGEKNPLAKVEHYLDASQMTWKKTSNRKANPSTLATVGKIDTPEGSPPRLPTGSNWLLMGVSTTKRGSAFQTVKEWRASGPRGWNTIIYGA